MKNSESTVVARAAVKMAISESREEEHSLKNQYAAQDVLTAAVDVGGDYFKSINKMVEKAIVAAKREGLIGEDSHHGDGCVAVACCIWTTWPWVWHIVPFKGQRTKQGVGYANCY